MKKQYQVIRAFGRGQSKPHIFDNLEDAIKCAKKMNRTGKTKAEIKYGYISNSGYSISDFEEIAY